MEDLFRFVLTRPAQQGDAGHDRVPVAPSGEIHKTLKTARSSDNATALRRVVVDYAQSGRLLRATADLDHGGALQSLLDALRGGGDRSLPKLSSLIQELFEASPGDIVGNARFQRDRERLSDTLVVNAILSAERGMGSAQAGALLRAVAIVSRVADGDERIGGKGGVARALDATLVLPESFPLPGPSFGQAPANPDKPEPPAGARLEALRETRERLLSTYRVLTRVSPDSFVSAEHVDVRPDVRDGPVKRSSLPPVVLAEDRETHEADPARDPATSTVFVERKFAMPLAVKPAVAEAFDDNSRRVLADRGLDVTRMALPSAVDRLSVELGQVELDLADADAKTHVVMKKVGGKYLDPSLIAILPYLPAIPLPPLRPPSVPETHGSVAPAGIGDLLVVKQFLKRYEARELAHVENVLIGETKERMHRRARTTEETITTETETKKEEERDQQTTERFELKSESSRVQKEDTSLKIGASVSGKYGPVVEFKVSADFALNTSKEEASKVATSYSKDITTRATSRIFERRREERILKTIEVFEEKNTHGLSNLGGAKHVVGQYQWIDKVYEAQVFNYGKRLLFDIMLPEPAAFLLRAFDKQPDAGADLVKPLPFTLKPTDLNEWNYAFYVSRYEVVGVLAPPEPYLVVAKAIEGKGEQGSGATKTLEIPLNEGYRAVAYEWISRFNSWPGGSLDVIVLPEPVGGKVGTITLAAKTYKTEAFTVSLAIHCQRTDIALENWKLKTHAAILQAYQKQLRDYEERLAALEVQAQQQFQGRNPLENENLIRTELKKGALSVFTAQHFDLFGAIETSPQGYPQSNLPEADIEGKYVRFFEQAFEWEQMMYFFYPYFWGRKPNWTARALLQDVDPVFAEFLKAGSARAVVSVRPGFEKAVAHFLDTGQIWNGGDLPDISSPLYVSIIEEIRERDKAPGAEIAQGDPWDVRLPTTLVKLRDEDTLPSWSKNAQGEWVPV